MKIILIIEEVGHEVLKRLLAKLKVAINLF